MLFKEILDDLILKNRVNTRFFMDGYLKFSL